MDPTKESGKHRWVELGRINAADILLNNSDRIPVGFFNTGNDYNLILKINIQNTKETELVEVYKKHN